MHIETARTIIRNFTVDDSPDLFDYLSNPEVYQYEPGLPITLEDAKNVSLERSKGNNFIAVADKSTDKLIGHFSFFQTEPDYVKTYELGFIFNPRFQGSGYATESGKAFIDYCFSELHIHKLVSNCNPANTKSWKLLERLGFKREGLLLKNIYFNTANNKPIWLDTFVYGLLSDR